MNAAFVLTVAAALAAPAAEGNPPLELEDLIGLSREMTGLLDGYLEAVPECPPRADTPIRRWRMDSAWIRAAAVFEAVCDTAGAPAGADSAAWREYIEACNSLLDRYEELMEAYHGGLPDSAAAERLEDGLLGACSLYAAREEALLDLLEEEVRQ
jgi:hypothetical protein